EKSYGYELQSDFASLGDIVHAAASNVHPLRRCLDTALSVPTSVAGGHWFGNFLSALTAGEFSPEPVGQQSGDKYYTKDDLKNFIDNVHQPSLKIMGFYASRTKLAWARLAEDLSSPSPTIDGLNQKLAASYDPATPCTVAGGESRVSIG